VARRVFAIAQQTRTATLRTGHVVRAASQARMRRLYSELLQITGRVVRQAERVERVRRRDTIGPLTPLRHRLRNTVELVQRVLAQTRARVFRGDIHYRDKVLSIFEPHTEAIRKGKATKLTEFGKLVKIQEAEAQFITDYEVCPTRVPTGRCGSPRWCVMHSSSGIPRRLAVADAAFASHRNDRVARQHGVRCVVLPRQRREAGRGAFEPHSDGALARKGGSAC
jgi:hypothetical protein